MAVWLYVNVNGSNVSAFVSTLVLIILNVSWKATQIALHFAHLAMDISKRYVNADLA